MAKDRRTSSSHTLINEEIISFKWVAVLICTLQTMNFNTEGQDVGIIQSRQERRCNSIHSHRGEAHTHGTQAESQSAEWCSWNGSFLQATRIGTLLDR